jgi:D-isomer specific 2-hydroxyacid dehydrogenase-like protein
MSKIQVFPLTVTRSLLNRSRAAEFHFGEDTALVAVQHMLLQTVDLFQTIGAIGLNLKNAFALGKVYSNSPPVIQSLREMGVTVLESTTPRPGEFHSFFHHDVQRLWRVATEALRHRNIRRVLILDDAGLCITNTPAEVLQRYSVCAVEQTSQGMFLFEESPPPFAVLSWARSAVKLHIGGPIFSQSFLENLNTEYLRGRSLSGASVGVIGLGSIGRAAAKLMARQGARVRFYDPHVPEASPGTISRAKSLEELMTSCDYVVGCSGRNPFRRQWPVRYRPGIKLFSASGGDHEFGPIINDLKRKSDFQVDSETWTITSKQGPSGPIEIAYLGYPYNFVSRDLEAVPTRIVQLETAGLLAALIQARFYLQVCERRAKDNAGLHRVAPRAQHFVFDGWIRTMREQGINLIELFGYEEQMLSEAQHEHWFSENTDLAVSGLNETATAAEDLMERFLNRVAQSGCKGNSERNFRPFRDRGVDFKNAAGAMRTLLHTD